ncbi:MAG: carboxymuconolactone decarboxylase family protein [Canibacter sp.]
MNSLYPKPPFLDKSEPTVWTAAGKFSASVKTAAQERGLSLTELELIKVRASQLNECAYCLDLHTREARDAGVPQQQLDLLPAWREVDIFNDRETAILAIAEAVTQLPLSEDARADLVAARQILGDEQFTAAEWVAIAINTFNRVSILSTHPVPERKPS